MIIKIKFLFTVIIFAIVILVVVVCMNLCKKRNKKKIYQYEIINSPTSESDYESCIIDQSCSICLLPILSNDISIYTPCNHLFHTKCINKWLLTLQNRNEDITCPNCRAQINLS
jgi:hypothetical protein